MENQIMTCETLGFALGMITAATGKEDIKVQLENGEYVTTFHYDKDNNTVKLVTRSELEPIVERNREVKLAALHLAKQRNDPTYIDIVNSRRYQKTYFSGRTNTIKKDSSSLVSGWVNRMLRLINK